MRSTSKIKNNDTGALLCKHTARGALWAEIGRQVSSRMCSFEFRKDGLHFVHNLVHTMTPGPDESGEIGQIFQWKGTNTNWRKITAKALAKVHSKGSC